jgi:hypothetical protein
MLVTPAVAQLAVPKTSIISVIVVLTQRRRVDMVLSLCTRALLRPSVSGLSGR